MIMAVATIQELAADKNFNDGGQFSSLGNGSSSSSSGLRTHSAELISLFVSSKEKYSREVDETDETSEEAVPDWLETSDLSWLESEDSSALSWSESNSAILATCIRQRENEWKENERSNRGQTARQRRL